AAGRHVTNYTFTRIKPATDQGNFTTRSLLGHSYVAANAGGAVQPAFGVSGWAENFSTQSVNSLYGVEGWAYNANGGVVSNIYGASTQAESDAGTISNLGGNYFWTGSFGGTVTSQYGI